MFNNIQGQKKLARASLTISWYFITKSSIIAKDLTNISPSIAPHCSMMAFTRGLPSTSIPSIKKIVPRAVKRPSSI